MSDKERERKLMEARKARQRKAVEMSQTRARREMRDMLDFPGKDSRRLSFIERLRYATVLGIGLWSILAVALLFISEELSERLMTEKSILVMLVFGWFLAPYASRYIKYD